MIIKDINGDEEEEIIDIVISAGTDGYLSAAAFDLHNNWLKRSAGVNDLGKNEESVAALSKK